MHHSTAPAHGSRTNAPTYRERLAPSLKILAGSAIVAPMLCLVFIRIDQAVSLVLGVAAAVLLIALLVGLSPVVQLSGRELRAGRARIDISFLGEAEQLTGEDAARARGTGLDPRGWYLIRGGIDGIVRVQNTDPDDPVRSWTISSRTPDRVVAAIRRAQRSATP